MAGPDEFSYLLMADHFLKGGGLSLKADPGRDTFYPPGFPLLLAGWSKLTGGTVTVFRAHALNAVLLCVDTLIAYFFARRLLAALATRGHRRFHYGAEAQAWIALLAAGIFATNWHILETSLLIMSEPAFMLATFAWLVVALRWRAWPQHIGQATVVGLLATAAWSIRGAGIVCVAVTILYPALQLAGALRARSVASTGAGAPSAMRSRIAALAILLLLVVAYQGALKVASPEKALASGKESANSYTDQLLGGLTDGHRLRLSSPADWPKVALNLRNLVFDHFADYASSFVPWPRENPDWPFRIFIGKAMGILGLLGWAWHATRLRIEAGARAEREPSPVPAGAAPDSLRFLELFVLLYVGLYLVWPFNFARFWSPILPIMLVYAADAVVRFSLPRRGLATAAAPMALLGLLLALSGIELRVQLGNYARRLHYVSDALARSVDAIVRRAPDPAVAAVAAMNGDDHFALAWYFSQRPSRKDERGEVREYRIHSPLPHVAAKEGAPESVEEMLLRLAEGQREVTVGEVGGTGQAAWRIYLFSYFAHRDARGVFANLQRRYPGLIELVAEGSHAATTPATSPVREGMAPSGGDGPPLIVEKIQQQEIISAVWEIRPRPSAARGP
jgi:hypothetical protein